ncbi:NAD-dependent deacylase [Acinetobacter sp. A3.8]|uniref:NAD-dependent protein deacylase n=1 Tax=Acinetobacter sedimenti TaxID=2919922 RepID=A0A9X1X401_9GAMM|nr:NAD-dependent deacylase [Acinetobacter sedimenti]MCJ8147506.1 NAD-dependent deacylase [Acinetobacter sedimenti]
MKKLVVFSGAGMSAESGINTFRDSDGLWENYRIEDVATPEAWAKNPKLVQQFYNQRRKQIIEAKPNSAHLAIAELEKDFQVRVITQNIDDLHERAGSQNVLHLHGNIRLAKSSQKLSKLSLNQEESYYPIEGWELDLERDLCPQGYPLRPHVVWFGEAVPAYEQAIHMANDADIFIVIGTSLAVYPVAALVHEIPTHCRAFYIDPKADHQQIPSQYERITMTASEGMQYIQDVLQNDND